MRITFLSPPPNLSGGERVVAIYAREFAKRGHGVQVICSRPPAISLKRQITSLLKGHGWPRQPKIGASHYENYGIRYRVVDHDGPLTDSDVPDADAVIATMWQSANYAAAMPSNKGMKFYLVQHDEGTIWRDFGAERTFTYDMFHIYVSQWIANRIRQRHPTARSIVIPNAIEAEIFNNGIREKPQRLRVGLMWADDPEKGGDIAISAVRQIRRNGLDCELVAFGIAPPPANYVSEFDEITLQPTQEKLVEIYRSCSVWLFTSRFEGFGLPILEAMASGTPVIGTATGAAPELLSHGGGFLVPNEDSLAIAKAIELVSALTSSEWQTYSEAARKTAQSRTWAVAASEFENFLLANSLSSVSDIAIYCD